MLYILPLNDEEQIHFTGGKFVTPEEIEMNSAQYSSFSKRRNRSSEHSDTDVGGI